MVALISMATSSGDDLSRQIEFLYSRNRLNVAISRARCLAVIVASPRLLETSCSTIEQAAVGPAVAAATPPEAAVQLSFAGLDDAALLSVGVPADWLGDVRAATEDTFFDVAAHLPAEAAEALLQYATAGTLPTSAPPPVADAYAHPDAQRRIRLIVDEEELRQALEYPWERWGVFLHPSQRAVVERRFAGPARVAGSAGTGKTVVALHRAVALARKNPQARVLLTTFSEPLARSLAAKLAVLAPETGGIVPRITVSDWHGVADELFQLIHGRRPRIVATDMLRTMIAKAAKAAGVRGFTHALSGVGVDQRRRCLGHRRTGTLCDCAAARAALAAWPAPARAAVVGVRAGRAACASKESSPAAGSVARSQRIMPGARRKPFDHIVVDEAQDLGPAELAFLAAIAPPGEDALFFAGDIGQRIFQHPFSWKALGIDVRGRSSTLKVCYRTSRQIRSVADRLLPGALRDPDGNEEERAGTISVFDGPVPVIAVVADAGQEVERVADFLRSAIADGIEPSEIGVFVRSPEVIGRARAASEASGPADRVTVSVMHLAKGLEFRAVAVMACDQDVLPLDSRIAEAADEGELDDIYETERQLLYVSCTRARDRLLVAGVAPGSEFLKDL